MGKIVSVRKLAGALLTLAVLAGAASALSACNTYDGFGKDMQDAGKSISNSSGDK